MPTTVTELITRIRQRTDNEHTDSEFVDNNEILGLINTAYKELYALLTRYGLHQDELIEPYTATGAQSYALPVAFYSLIAVFRLDGTRRITLGRHDWRYKLDSALVGPAATYRIVGSSIEFDPIPQSGSYEIRYIPLPTDLTLVSSIDGVVGWEEYVVAAAARDIFEKEGFFEASQVQESKRERLEARIKTEKETEEQTQSNRIQDVRSRPDHILLEGQYLDRQGLRGTYRRQFWRR